MHPIFFHDPSRFSPPKGRLEILNSFIIRQQASGSLFYASFSMQQENLPRSIQSTVFFQPSQTHSSSVPSSDRLSFLHVDMTFTPIQTHSSTLYRPIHSLDHRQYAFDSSIHSNINFDVSNRTNFVCRDMNPRRFVLYGIGPDASEEAVLGCFERILSKYYRPKNLRLDICSELKKGQTEIFSGEEFGLCTVTSRYLISLLLNRLPVLFFRPILPESFLRGLFKNVQLFQVPFDYDIVEHIDLIRDAFGTRIKRKILKAICKTNDTEIEDNRNASSRDDCKIMQKKSRIEKIHCPLTEVSVPQAKTCDLPSLWSEEDKCVSGCARLEGILGALRFRVWRQESAPRNVLVDSDSYHRNRRARNRTVARTSAFRQRLLKVDRSTIHLWGLFSLEMIYPNEFVCFYLGELISRRVAELREARYIQSGVGGSYLFRCDEFHVVDATRIGNLARYMNHSCDPNACARVITVAGKKRIAIYAKRIIRPGDEITYDYKFPIEEDKIPCMCGSRLCRGYLN